MIGMFLYQGHFGWKGRLGQETTGREARVSPSAQSVTFAFRGRKDAHDSLQAHTVHSPGSDEVEKYCMIFRERLFLLQSKTARRQGRREVQRHTEHLVKAIPSWENTQKQKLQEKQKLKEY